MHDIRRHREIFDPGRDERPVLIVGCGATGSHIAMQLAALGVRHITIVDPDTVSAHNIANQIFDMSHVDIPKVHAFEQILTRKFGSKPMSMNLIRGRLPEAFSIVDTDRQANRMGVNPVLILAVDTMEARKEIVTALMDRAALSEIEWYIIDTRMAAAHGNVMGFWTNQHAGWARTIIRDEDAEASPCGAARSVIPTVQIIAGFGVWEYLKFCTDPDALEERIDIFLKPTALHTGIFMEVVTSKL